MNILLPDSTVCRLVSSCLSFMFCLMFLRFLLLMWIKCCSVWLLSWICLLCPYSPQTSSERWRRRRATPPSPWPALPTSSTRWPTTCCRCWTSRPRSCAAWRAPSTTFHRLVQRPEELDGYFSKLPGFWVPPPPTPHWCRNIKENWSDLAFKPGICQQNTWT